MKKPKNKPDAAKWSDEVRVEVVKADAGFLPSAIQEACKKLDEDGFNVIACNVVQPHFYEADGHMGAICYIQKIPPADDSDEQEA